LAQSVIAFKPLAVVQGPPIQSIPGDALHGPRGRQTKRSHGRMVQIDEVPGDGEEFAVHEIRVIFRAPSASKERILEVRGTSMRRAATFLGFWASVSLIALSLFAADKKKDPDEIG